MTTKEKFLRTLKDKIKVYQDAYDYNKSLPDDVFESLNGHSISTIDPKKYAPRQYKVSLGSEYGANINALREIIKNAGSEGVSKGDMVKKFPEVEGDKYIIVTNALSSLNKSGEIEKTKPKGKRMRGFYWRMKA